ncbi:hypothetical protein D915_001539 [Fasciola hepatica]|uniref:Uncharacterized protein n=1 Tax=Fasciola hepatica TaxID=6192 RepID=A0A4E0RWT4_FASHE|nr:hypothetical protein D915_001539 [Fasciola hepatica]
MKKPPKGLAGQPSLPSFSSLGPKRSQYQLFEDIWTLVISSFPARQNVRECFTPASVPSTGSIASTTSSFINAVITTNPTSNAPIPLPTSVVANPVGLSTSFGTQSTLAISGNASVATTSAQPNPAQSKSLFNFNTLSLTTSTSFVSVSSTPMSTATLVNFGSSNHIQRVTKSGPVPSIFSASEQASAPTLSTAVVPSTQSLFSFSSSPSTNTTVGNTSTVSLSVAPGLMATPQLFNFGSSSSTEEITVGNTTGFNFGQTSCFANSNSSVTNPFAFGTTPPTAAGTTGAVALPRRRPASARRTRRV